MLVTSVNREGDLLRAGDLPRGDGAARAFGGVRLAKGFVGDACGDLLRRPDAPCDDGEPLRSPEFCGKSASDEANFL